MDAGSSGGIIPARFRRAHRCREIRNQDGIGPGSCRFGKEFFNARRIDEVDVEHQTHRHVGMGIPETTEHAEASLGRGAARERTLRGEFDHRSVRTRVRKGNAEFKGVGARFGKRIENGKRSLFVRVAEIDEGNKGAFVLLLKGGKKSAETIGHDICLLDGLPLSGRPA